MRSVADYIRFRIDDYDVTKVRSMLNGFTLVRVKESDEHYHGNSMTLKLGKNKRGVHYDEVSNFIRRGEIVSIHDDCGLEIGDEVWFDVNQSIESDKYSHNGHLYYTMEERFFIVVKRGDDIFCVNDKVVGRQIESTYNGSLISVAKSKLNEVELEYVGESAINMGLSAGDVVVTKISYLPELEEKGHLFLDGKEHVYFDTSKIVGKV